MTGRVTPLCDVAASPAERDLLTVANAATYSGVPTTHLRRMIRDGRITYYRVGGWAVRIAKRDLDALVVRVEASKQAVT